jgi:hypothetical protein
MTGQLDHLAGDAPGATLAGLNAARANLIHHYSNAIYLLPAQSAVARITYGHEAAEQVARSQAITGWLAQEQHFPPETPGRFREPFQHGLTQTNILQHATARRRALLDTTLRPIFDCGAGNRLCGRRNGRAGASAADPGA